MLLRTLSLAAFVTLAASSTASAANVQLRWNANAESDIAGYKVYYGTSPASLSSTANPGLVLSSTVSGLADGQTYYFAVSAYNTAGEESSASAVVQIVTPDARSSLDTDGDGTPDLLDADDDNDGLTDVVEISLGTNPLLVDTDGDGYSDAQETQDGSNPLDAASNGPQYTNTICSEWNGYLGGMWNILELINMSTHALATRVMLYTQNGTVGAQMYYSIPAGDKLDSLVHDYPGWALNAYGNVCVSYNGNPSDLSGQMVYYKTASPKSVALGEAYDFAIALSLGTGRTGAQHVLFDTIQRSQLTADRNNLVANWIQVANRGQRVGTGKLRFYNYSGTLLGERAVAVAPSGRADFAAHQFGPNQEGLVEWLPDDSDISYQVRNVRYLYDNPGTTDTFSGAVVQDAVTGTSQTMAIPIATDASQNANVVLSNVANVATTFSLTVYDSTGKAVSSPQRFSLSPKQCWHYNYNTLLKSKKGIAVVQATVANSLIGAAIEFTRKNRTLGMMYLVPAVTASGTLLRGPFNNYLGQQSVVWVLNPATVAQTVQVAAASSGGLAALAPTVVVVPAKGVKVLAVTGADQYGVETTQSDQSNALVSWVMRVRSDYVIPTLAHE